jgi:hypothetical protein
MVAEVCGFYGWTLEYVLNMPARSFFAMRRASFDILGDQFNRLYLGLCDVAAIPLTNHKYVEELKTMYLSRSGIKAEKKAAHFFDAKDPRAAEVLGAALRQKLRIEYGQ